MMTENEFKRRVIGIFYGILAVIVLIYLANQIGLKAALAIMALFFIVDLRNASTARYHD